MVYGVLQLLNESHQMCIRDRYLQSNIKRLTHFTSQAVSYTHLDVYKRQEVDIKKRRVVL
ncbi:hypothetical protein A5884_000877 [Enterococcus sp. 7D2_DIV0200]|nr:hypothetical protein A5884_000877 [Enterococcus sp. 7D2_DIV0200]